MKYIKGRKVVRARIYDADRRELNSRAKLQDVTLADVVHGLLHKK